ncbi:unnamed protein product [Schistocephalus solidus]|uniref:Uncharacterized protein n=1 Tax=Schistocephalus solidus TaxID=70667 RepID=A0A183TB48_SCHSO|nr:unnamed protein product [Schistocephalus solidus]
MKTFKDVKTGLAAIHQGMDELMGYNSSSATQPAVHEPIVHHEVTLQDIDQSCLPYEKLLSNLDLFPLDYRQLRGNLIQAFCMLRGQDCCLASGDFFELATTNTLRGHPIKLRVTGARLDKRIFSFSNRVIKAWNALPANIIMSSSVDTFKRKFDQYNHKYHHDIRT